MGIVRTSARLMLDESKRRPFEGAVLELARMAIYFRHDELATWARAHDVALDPSEPDSGEPDRGVPDSGSRALSHDPRLAAQGCLSDTRFFQLLGFDEVVSLDVSGYEGVDLVHDMNQPIPADLRERFDVVFEGGTIQHIYDQRQIFRNIHDALKPGGRVIHAMSPSNNHVDLGFYMYSPTLFADVYSTFGYTMDAFYLFDYVPYWFRGRYFSRPARVYRYEPGCLDHLSYGRWGNRQTSMFIVATKSAGASADRTPQQGEYRRIWQATDGVESTPTSATAPEAYVRAPRPVLWWKMLREHLLRLLPKKMPPTVARY